MRRLVLLLLLIALAKPGLGSEQILESPSKINQIRFVLSNGVPLYEVYHRGEKVIEPSRMGFLLRDFMNAQGRSVLGENMSLVTTQRETVDYWWEQVWGEEHRIQDNHNELLVTLQQDGPLSELKIRFRAFDDGVAFRYEFSDLGPKNFSIFEELTEFNLMSGDIRAWWIPAFTGDRYEHLYRKTPLWEMPAVHTPLTLTRGKLSIAIHEANLTDFASMTIVGGNANRLRAKLVPWANGIAVLGKTPMVSPWRTIQIADKPADLITSYLGLNLNEPNKLEDTSWITPKKYMGIWWGMHLNEFTWGSGPKHGATTRNSKEYIDAAKRLNIPALLIEGWNYGWDGDWIGHGWRFDFTRPYPDFDLVEVARYAKEKGVSLIGHHETAGAITNYERQADAGFKLYQSLGVDMVKTGYVQTKVEGGEWHHGQYMVRHYRKNVELAAKYKIMLDVHEPIKDTGLRRTYPNMMSREGARGIEYDAWSQDGGNPPDHVTIIPFTRGLSGPFDITPGIFDLSKGVFPKGSTIAKQLALYVVVYSPIHMAADLPRNYEGHPALKFILDVPTDWQTTKALGGEIGDYLVIARKDRNSADWYVGLVNDEHARDIEVDMKFLDLDGDYSAEIYSDGPKADYHKDPHDLKISRRTLNSRQKLKVRLAPGGGAAIRLSPTPTTNVE